MSTIKNDRIIRALLRQPVDCTPVWIMRQAGRYLPEYRKLRAEVPDFMTFCQTPELAAQATLQPLARFPLDAAIIFSDILTIPAAMGMSLQFVGGQGPQFSDPLRSASAIEQLCQPDVEQDLGYVFDAIRLVVKQLENKVPLIGFAGSPWTVATYMIEGGSSKIFHFIKSMMYDQPTLLHGLLEKLTAVTVDYLNLQIAAGARVMMLFDTWGGVLTGPTYREFSLQYMQKIAEQLQRERDGQRIPVVFFTKHAAQWLDMIANSGCDAVGLDWTVDIAQAKRQIGDRVALQGNLDPMLLYSNPQKIEQAVEQIMQAFGQGSGHVFNLGHGIDKDTPIDHVKVMVDAVHQYGKCTV